jgi:hypothetical protein
VRPANFIIVTSIFPPTPGVRALAQLPEWQVVVVGDQRTPPDWAVEGVTYLSPEMQTELAYETSTLLPWNHYSRKMIGYLYAMSCGANVIAETDDDNIPTSDWALPDFRGEFDVIRGDGFVNVYRLFTDAVVWPRGFPLRRIRDESRAPTVAQRRDVAVGIWQFLTDEDPDVDAIFRLVFDTRVSFAARPPVVLDVGTACPFNSQNTIFSRAAFPLLYLPAFVTFRFTDILRGLVAQPVLWAADLRLAFGGATVRQERNAHETLKDFEDEIPMYLQTETALETAQEVASPGHTIDDNLRAVYIRLEQIGVVEERELALLDAWLSDVAWATS